ncbi:MAG: AraC family transcriptional regulator [Candidatus Dormibacter sp.]
MSTPRPAGDTPGDGVDDRVRIARRGVAAQSNVEGPGNRAGASGQVRAPRTAPRPSTAAGTRRIVDIARELVTVRAAAPSLQSLATATSTSPHYLTRVFKESTGMTLTRYRNRVRVRLALEWLAEGEDDLTRIAHDLGFADHAHFSRTVLAELGLQPRIARGLLYATGALNVSADEPRSAPPDRMTAGSASSG